MFFDPIFLNGLIQGLKQMPEQPTLMEFRDELRALFQKLHEQNPELFEDERGKVVRSPIQRLARGFECDPTKKRFPHVKDDSLHGAIRSLRHMIYNHQAIKEDLPTEGKKILIPYRARLQILLAKRLSGFRVMREQREHLLALEAKQLEELLGEEDARLKARVSEGLDFDRSSRRRLRDDSGPRWKRRGMPFHKIGLARGVRLEIDDRFQKLEQPEEKQAALEKFLEVMFDIERGSEASEDLVTEVLKASSEAGE